MTSEDARYNVRRLLASRPTASLTVEGIRHGLARWGETATDDEITAACVFLMGLSPAQVMGQIDPLGSTTRYQITSAGVLAFERNQ